MASHIVDTKSKLILALKEKPRATMEQNRAYIDTGHNLQSIRLTRHSVVFGRRGSGKTMLLSELASYRKIDSCWLVWIDIDDYKTLTFPDILIQILRSIFQDIRSELIKNNWWVLHPIRRWKAWTVLNQLESEENFLRNLLERFEESELKVERGTSTKRSRKRKSTLASESNFIDASIGEENDREDNSTYKESASGKDQKINRIGRHLHDAKHILRDASQFSTNVIYIVLDDFYHLGNSDQAQVLDFLQSLTKNINVFIKFGTIAHRSRIFQQRDQMIIGMQKEHDVLSIDLDRTFQNFTEVEQFISRLWSQILETNNIDVDLDLFGGHSWKQLVLASGGTPRDFMNILAKALELSIGKEKDKLSVFLVNEAANMYLRDTKQEDLNSDGKDKSEELEGMLADIRDFCIRKKKRNLFLVDKDQLESMLHAQELLRQLLDYRFIHLVHNNTSAVGRPGRYEAYMLDVGVYSHPPRRGENKVEQVDFLARDDKHRSDTIRTQPVYPIKESYASISEDPFSPLADDNPTDGDTAADTSANISDNQTFLNF